jgi:hypothetical protein
MTNRHGDERRVEVIAHSFYLLPQLVLGTSRLATMHTRLAKQLAATLPIRLVKPEFEIPDSSKYCNGTSTATSIRAACGCGMSSSRARARCPA